MNYSQTYVGQVVRVIHHGWYPDTYVGCIGVITKKFEGIDDSHGTVMVELKVYRRAATDEAEYPIARHMGTEQLAEN